MENFFLHIKSIFIAKYIRFNTKSYAEILAINID